MAEPLIRPVSPDDVPAIAAIYRYYVAETVISFESDPPDDATMAARIAEISGRFPYLVIERDDRIVGYAYASAFQARAAYRWIVETSIYLDQHARGGGLGRPLYEALLEDVRDRGFLAATGKITLPNAASVGLHEKLGFDRVGTYRSAGHKFGSWHDVGLFQRDFGPRPALPAEPVQK
jgi:phosphinothricin acetyltransferase